MSDNEKELKTHYGTVIFFKKTYGFIEWDLEGQNQIDMFVHWSDISQENGYKTLYSGQKVSFQIGNNLRDQPKALNVTVLK